MGNILQWLIPAIIAGAGAMLPSILQFRSLQLQLKADREKDALQLQKNKDEILESISNQNKIEDDSLRCLLRTEILKIYFKHVNAGNKQLPQWEAENLRVLYAQADKLGNTEYIRDIYNQMKSWEIVKD